MRKILLIPLIVLMATPAAADLCDELWFIRNLVMDRAGYCFGSKLGRATFDNSDCTGKSVSVPRRDQSLVQRIRTYEQEIGCKVDTSRTTLEVRGMDYLWRIRDLPVPGEGESGCIGWKEAPTPLYSARDFSSPVISTVRDGDNLSYVFWSEGGWEFVIIHNADWSRVKGAGWLGFRTDTNSCRQWAG